MFERYTQSNRRVIYFAREATFHAAANQISGEALLLGLLREPANRANVLFQLCDKFPNDAKSQSALAKFPDPHDVPLTNESKRILAYAAEEADRINSYAIGTEHLLLGILREKGSAAARKLVDHGIKLTEARRVVTENPDPSIDPGSVPATWHPVLPAPDRRWRKALIWALLIGSSVGLFIVQNWLSR